MRPLVLAALLALPVFAQPDCEPSDCALFRASRLEAVIGDNAVAGEHRAGYNGIFRLTAPGAPDNLYVPVYAGVNLEHYFDASPRSPDSAIFFDAVALMPGMAPLHWAGTCSLSRLNRLATGALVAEEDELFETLGSPAYSFQGKVSLLATEGVLSLFVLMPSPVAS